MSKRRPVLLYGLSFLVIAFLGLNVLVKDFIGWHGLVERATMPQNIRYNKVSFTPGEILRDLDNAYDFHPGPHYPMNKPADDVESNFFLELEHGYCETAGSRIHLYADSTHWAIVFEKSGYQNKGFVADIQLDYIGNCINNPEGKEAGKNYTTNSASVELISEDEFDRIENKTGDEMEQFEMISATANEVKVRNRMIPIEHDPAKYSALGIEMRGFDNPNRLVGFSDLLRYISETQPEAIKATEEEIRTHITGNIPKLMTIDKFHFISVYNDRLLPPSKQETYQLIAKILAMSDTSLWKPTLAPNNHWSNWKSGQL